MSKELNEEEHFAVGPFTAETENLAKQMSSHWNKAGIGIILVREGGTII